jgi:hypothetical protein
MCVYLEQARTHAYSRKGIEWATIVHTLQFSVFYPDSPRTGRIVIAKIQDFEAARFRVA